MQDQPSRGLAHDIAVLLARRYLQADKGRYAWASVRTLAKELGVARTSVIRALGKLIADGWLVCEAGGKGAGDSNHYFLPERIPVPIKGSADATLNAPNKGSVHAQKGSRPRTIRVAPTHNKGSADATQVRYSEGGAREERGSSPLRGDSLSAPASISWFGNCNTAARQRNGTGGAVPAKAAAGTKQQHGQSTARHEASPRQAEASPRQAKPNRNARSGKPGGSPFPDGWVLGDAELAIAVSVCGWDSPKAEDEFAKFKARALDKGWTSNNWSAAWTTWCQRGRDYAAEHPRRHRTFAEKYAGLATWAEAGGTETGGLNSAASCQTGSHTRTDPAGRCPGSVCA